jgi:UDP-N-acetylenolpyruvoylglucosamine reductase
MNAGAMGVETFDQVVSVRFLDEMGELHEKSRDEFTVHYRNVPEFSTHYAVSATFRGVPNTEVTEIDNLLEASKQKRRTSQPIAASAGCIFKNPEGCPAGKLVDELGLKESRVGHAAVSTAHGNFIVNEGGATATEVLELIDQIKKAAKSHRGIELQTEVQIIGQEGLI